MDTKFVLRGDWIVRQLIKLINLIKKTFEKEPSILGNVNKPISESIRIVIIKEK